MENIVLIISLPLLLMVPISSSKECKFNVKLEQYLHNDGFHRNISYDITLNGDCESDDWFYKNCIIGLEQMLPPGVYVITDELEDLRRANRINIFPKSKVNIELPAEQSPETTVYVIGKVADDNLVRLWLPVHARYHETTAGGGFARNEIYGPKLYLRCPDERLHLCNIPLTSIVASLCEGSKTKRCDWKEIPFTTLTEAVMWDVPVGDVDHYYIVSLGTVLMIAVGSLSILKTIHEYKMDKRKKS